MYERVYSYCKVKEKLYPTSPPRRSDVGKPNARTKDSKFLNKYNCRIILDQMLNDMALLLRGQARL